MAEKQIHSHGGTPVARFIAEIMLIAADIAALVYFFIAGLDSTPFEGAANVFICLGLTVAALAVWYFVHNVLHESFHLIFAKIKGAKILEFGVIGLLIYTEGDRKKFSLNLRSAYAGWVSFVCDDPEKSKPTLIISLVGGLVGTLLTAAVILAVYLSTRNYITYYLVFMGLFTVAYMIIVNYLVGTYTSDGAMLFSKKLGGKHLERSADNLRTESYLYRGFSLAEIPTAKGVEGAGYYDALACLERGDVEGAKRIIETGLDEKNIDNEVIALLFEKMFIACIQKDDKTIEQLKYVFTDYDERAAYAYRAQIAYRLYTGETEWAKTIEKTYSRQLEKLPLSGLIKTERNIYKTFVRPL